MLAGLAVTNAACCDQLNSVREAKGSSHLNETQLCFQTQACLPETKLTSKRTTKRTYLYNKTRLQ